MAEQRSENSSAGSPEVQLSQDAEARLRSLAERYPQSQSLVMPALYIAQEELGMINDDAIRWVSRRLDIAPAHVIEVATFYTMYYKTPVGKYHIQICRTLSCALRGAKMITDFVEQRLGIKPGEVTEDGMWSFEEVECLGSCGTAPMVQINDVFFELQSPETLAELVDRIEKEQPDLRYSTIRQELGSGLSDMPRSMVWQARMSEAGEE